jgi:hypothetical protein
MDGSRTTPNPDGSEKIEPSGQAKFRCSSTGTSAGAGSESSTGIGSGTGAGSESGAGSGAATATATGRSRGGGGGGDRIVFKLLALLRVAVALVGIADSDSIGHDDPFLMTVQIEVTAAQSATAVRAATIAGNNFLNCTHCSAGRGGSAHDESNTSGENRAGHGNRHALRKSHGAYRLGEIETKGPEPDFYETITPRGDTSPYNEQTSNGCAKGSPHLTLCRMIH